MKNFSKNIKDNCHNKFLTNTFFIIIFAGCSMKNLVPTNPDAEKHISKMLNKQVPYQIDIIDCSFVIKNKNVYPPGKLTTMFAQYLLENDLAKDKVVVDVGAGCFALGIIMAKHGAKEVVGIDINKDALICANQNIELNGVERKTRLVYSNGVSQIAAKFFRKVDLLVAGVPWDSLSISDYEEIPEERKMMSRAFYDVGDQLLTNVLSRGLDILSSRGKMFITASMRTIARINDFCTIYKANYTIVKEQDLHNDGNIHYILEIKKAVT